MINHVRVSTVWTGLYDRPFETMLFAARMRDKNAPWNEFTLRYKTEGQARRGHQVITSLLSSRGVTEIVKSMRRKEQRDMEAKSFTP